MDSVDRAGLADFLRRRRELVAPQDVGLPERARRRTPGLRREDVASLAGISVDYLVRLEQGRGPHPSTQVLDALARALRLSGDERDHVHLLAGHAPPRRTGRSGHVRPGLLHLLARLDDAAAMVSSDLSETLLQNDLSRALYGDEAARRGRDRSALWRWFTDPVFRDRTPAPDREAQSRIWVADLRATHTRRRGDADVEDLVAALLHASGEFVTLWERHEVAVRRSDTKRVRHPLVGTVELDCEVLLTPEHDQRLVVLSARPGTEAAEQLALLRVLGTQQLAGAR